MDLFQTLPTEVLCLIVDELLPVGWDITREGRNQLEKKLVCKRFDAVISYRAYKRIDLTHLMLMAPALSTDTAVWLLHQKDLAEGTTEVERTVTSPDSASLPARCGGSIETYLLWACRLAVSCQGATWICSRLADTLPTHPVRAYFVHSKLTLSAYLGDGHLARSLVAGGTNINECDELLGSPLVAATLGHQGDIARLLFQWGADAEQGVGCVGSALVVAARHQMKELVRLFLQCGQVNPNQGDLSGFTALYWSSRHGDADLVRLFLDHPSIDLRSDSHGRDALTCAAAEGHETIVQWLVEHAEVQVNQYDGRSGYALFEAVTRGHEKVVDCLLSRQDLEPNFRSYFWDTTPLVEAVRKGHENIVRSLLRFPATDPNARSWTYPSALCVASQKGSSRMVEMLLAHKDIKVNERDSRNRTSVSLAARHGREDVLRLLLNRDDVDVGLTDVFGQLPVMHASLKGRINMVRLLLLYQPSTIDAQDDFGETSLIGAVRRGHRDVVQVLLEFSPDIAMQDNRHRTALDYARELKHRGIETLLMQASGQASYFERRSASFVGPQMRQASGRRQRGHRRSTG